MASPSVSLSPEEPGAPADIHKESEQPKHTSSPADQVNSTSGGNEETEQALETHEVIELQAFIERKEWIEEKIQYLESLPSIEVFASVQEPPQGHNQNSVLATRAQLDDWLIEHDRIEKEMEIFDSGDLKKLKKLSKAVTQRNLSSEDTDLIEITLTTLFALDKLFHLLRSRSEQLDLLGLRLTWEDHCAKAYSVRSEILDESRTFLDVRAKWSPEVYGSDSVSLLMSVAGSSSGLKAIEVAEDFSRGARFRLAEELSRDAAQISSKITSLRHGPVTAAGKALDKLIDDSRERVPDFILDEQDKVEELCANHIASVGKFLMAAVMQWKKADEFYVETRKDSSAAQILIDDINQALKQHPIRRNEASFSARLHALTKRVLARTDPASSSTTFPLPTHPLFSDQSTFNTSLVRLLSSEINTARGLTSEADSLVSLYHANFETIELVEDMRRELSELNAKLSSTTRRLRDGFQADDGDGSPPDLSHPSCVEPLRSSAYLAMLPSLVEEALQGEQIVLKLVKRARLASSRLVNPGIDDTYRSSFVQEVLDLEAHLDTAVKVRDDVSRAVSKLRDVKRVWLSMDDLTRRLESIMAELRDALARHRWRQQIGGEMTPLTPESPRPVLPAELSTPDEIEERLRVLQGQHTQDIVSPLDLLSVTIPQTLYEYLNSRRRSIESFISDARSMNSLWLDVQRQTSAMECVREEVHALESRIEDTKVQYDDYFLLMLRNSDSSSEWPAHDPGSDMDTRESTLAKSADEVQADVKILIESLPTRVPLISRRTPSPGAFSPKKTAETLALRLPFDPAAVDRVVRGDSNAYTMRLSSGMKSLVYKRSSNVFYRTARDVDVLLAGLREDIRTLGKQLEDQSLIFSNTPGTPSMLPTNGQSSLASLRIWIDTVTGTDTPRIGQCISDTRKSIARMRSFPGVQDDVTNLGVLSARTSSLDEADLQLHRIFGKIETLKAEMTQAEQTEIARLMDKARGVKEAAGTEDRRGDLEESARLLKDEYDDRTFAEEKGLAEERDEIRTWKKDANKHDTQDARASVEEDVFGPRTPVRRTIDRESTELIAHIRSLRKRLKSIGLNAVVRPSGASIRHTASASLPTSETARTLSVSFISVEEETAELPASAQNAAADTELRSLRLEVEASRELVCRIQQLARLSSSIILCDLAFSEFLDHIDNCSAPLQKENGAAGTSALPMSPGERLSEKMSYTKNIVGDMSEQFGPVADDPRATAEYNRLKQTWEELMEMALEKINGRLSRPGSVTAYSSGRNSSASVSSVRTSNTKRNKYTNLSVSGRDGFLVPSSQQRRTVSSSSADSAKQSQNPSSKPRLSISRSHNARSISGPMSPPTIPIQLPASKSLYSSTFASRQRTTSVSSTTSSGVSGASRPHIPPGPMKRRMSSALSEAPRVGSPTVPNPRGTWSRAPRQSFGSFPRAATPEKGGQKRSKKYVANPRNKLDVAVGDVINSLPVDINVEVVAETWKDKSGKYWIGGGEPKLCFCRILRSQTVMVRVGGGWAELSRFIKDHFADLFRLIPESPPRPGSRERWINASTLRNSGEDGSISTRSPGSPDSLGPSLPSFALSTPDGTQVQAMQSQSPKSSPLTPLQFMRRADADLSELSLSSVALSTGPNGPSKSSSIRPRGATSSAPTKTVWRP
ncbi:hypothetical protein M0805_007477 [Coniferiporia weirii]|nr:hypothetical protein M0805_007477 [Coniferiporia weirii]